jgi:putative PIN family toxin of toxin-antitoxin system
VIRFVLDTNVLVSALRNPTGNEARIILLVRSGMASPCVSAEILHEYEGVLTRPKFRYPETTVTELLTLIRDRGELFQSSASSHEGPDPGDFIFMRCAVTAQADYLVTGNMRHFPDPFYGSARVVNARGLLERVAPSA